MRHNRSNVRILLDDLWLHGEISDSIYVSISQKMDELGDYAENLMIPVENWNGFVARKRTAAFNLGDGTTVMVDPAENLRGNDG